MHTTRASSTRATFYICTAAVRRTPALFFARLCNNVSMWPWLLVASGLLLLRRHEPRVDALRQAAALATTAVDVAPSGSIAVFDFDDTLVRPGTVIDRAHTGPRPYWGADRRSVPIYSLIADVANVLQRAHARGLRVVVLTARHENEVGRATLKANFERHGLPVDRLIMTPAGEDGSYKARVRADLAKEARVALTVGDQWMDVDRPGGAAYVKLPNRVDGRVYSNVSHLKHEQRPRWGVATPR